MCGLWAGFRCPCLGSFTTFTSKLTGRVLGGKHCALSQAWYRSVPRMAYFPGTTELKGCTATLIVKSPLYTLSFSSGEKGKARSLPGDYTILPKTISVSASIFKHVGSRNSDLSLIELI